MTQEQYLLQKQALQEDFDRRVRMLNQEHAFSNNPYKIGDVVTDHQDTIRIEKITWCFTFGQKFPECKYYGPTLKKDLTPTLNGNRRDVYQSNIKK